MSKIVPVAKAQIPQNPDQQVKMNETQLLLQMMLLYFLVVPLLTQGGHDSSKSDNFTQYSLKLNSTFSQFGQETSPIAILVIYIIQC